MISNRHQLSTRYGKTPATISKYIREYENSGHPVGRSGRNAVWVRTEEFDNFMIKERGKHDSERLI